MAQAYFGHVDEYLPGKSASWEQYIEQLEFYFQANDIANADKRRAILLSVCGQSTFALIRSLLLPKKPTDLTYQEIVAKVSSHISPKPSEIVQRFKFYKRDQLTTETVAEYVVALRKLTEFCNFGAQLDCMLRDRLVCGLRNETLQRRLLAEAGLTFQNALDITLAAETAQRHASEIRIPETSVSEVFAIHGAKQVFGKARNMSYNTCFRCGGSHLPSTCRFIDADCRFCGKKGHIERSCMSKNNKDGSSTRVKAKPVMKNGKQSSHAHQILQEIVPILDSGQRDPVINSLNQVMKVSSNPSYCVTLWLDGVQHRMEVDSGSACSIISDRTFHELWPNSPPKLEINTVQLRTWSHQELKVLGTAKVSVRFINKNCTLPLHVAEGSGISLLGRDWFDALGIGINGLDGTNVNAINSDRIPDILEAYSEVFEEELGTYNGPQVKLEVDSAVPPRFLRSRPIPFALRERVDAELERLVKQGILVPVKHSAWATPIVPVLKSDGSLRICGDYRSTVNQALRPDTYPLPNMSDLLASLAGGKKFTKIDLSQAYQQLPVDDETAMLLTINTPKGLFKVTRLPFGISAAPGIFQRCIESEVAGFKGVCAYLDDILVSGDDEDHDSRVELVLGRIADTGLRLKKTKCDFGVRELDFLGFRVNGTGIQPTLEKTEAIHRAPQPMDKTELQAFLGLLNFYNTFLQNKANVLEPLHRLLDKGAVWNWSKEHIQAFEEAKLLLQSTNLLVHYDGNRPLILVCDASPVGVGAVLSHVESDSRERPIAYASRTLSKTERNYAQIDREALALMFGISKFHKYLYGRRFTLVTDHKPLLGLLHNEKRMPAVMSPRMMRWSLLLSAYDYDLVHRPGKNIGNADGLSRLPLPCTTVDSAGPADIFMLEQVQDSPLNADKIALLSRRDPVLSQVLNWVWQGGTLDKDKEEYRPFRDKRDELSVHKGCLLWGNRVVIPGKMRQDVLQLLHESHPGIVKMKWLARSYVWWPRLDSDITTCVNGCTACQETRNNPARAPPHAWEFPERPWSRLHLDFAGPFFGQVFLLVVDSHSKWLEVLQVSSQSSQQVIECLRRLMATHGLPDVIVSDNGTAFTSEEFKRFLASNGIRGTTVSPYHPASNGQAERVVQTTKQALRKMSKGDWSTKLARLLLAQHTMPHSTTGVSPSELLMKRKLIIALDRLRPDLQQKVREGQERASNRVAVPTREFRVGDPVYMRMFNGRSKWMAATVTKITGPLSYVVISEDGLRARRHIDQLRPRQTNDIKSAKECMEEDLCLPTVPVNVPVIEQLNVEPQFRRSARVARQPRHLMDYKLD